MNELDAVIFTAGIDENSSLMRELVCKNMSYLGIQIDEEKNTQRRKEVRDINTQNSVTKVLVIPTNEELEMAKQSYALVNK